MNIREQKKIARWLVEGNTGMSSEAMCAFYMGYEYYNPRTPSDPSDLKRCYEFLKCVDPSNRGNLVLKMSGRSKGWHAIAKNWNALEALYKKECVGDHWIAPELYALMQSIGL